jgi:uncharacterized membrane protein (UPF0127 family)
VDTQVTVRREDGTVLCAHCVVAETMLSRARGLLGRAELARDEGILLRPASSIHMFFMRFPIDAVFLDRTLVVRKVVHRLRPWRMAFGLGSHAVLELSAGEAARHGVARGEQLTATAQ